MIIKKKVPGAGVEPARRCYLPRDFKSLASTSFATRAFLRDVTKITLLEQVGKERDRKTQGWGRNRTGVRGFAGRYITTLTPSHNQK